MLYRDQRGADKASFREENAMLESIVMYLNVYTLTAYVAVALVGWYFLNAFEYYLNSGTLGRGKWWVFECFWEELLESIPGGMKRKVARLKEMVGEPHPNVSGSFISGAGSWSYEELRENGDWENCARAMFKSPGYFWGVTVFAYFLLGGLVGPMVVAVWFATLPWKLARTA